MFRCVRCGAFNRVPSQRPPGAPTCGRCKEALDLSGAPQAVDAAAFERAVSGSPVPVLVDFWAPWCAPCRAAAPILDEVARAQAGNVAVLKVNTDEHPEPSARLGVRGIPCFVLFKDGRELGRQSGALPAPAMSRWLATHL